MGRTTVSASGMARFTPRSMARAAARALRLSLNESGARTIFIHRPPTLSLPTLGEGNADACQAPRAHAPSDSNGSAPDPQSIDTPGPAGLASPVAAHARLTTGAQNACSQLDPGRIRIRRRPPQGRY